MIERNTCVFPDPLSPTTPSASPGPIVKPTPSAARTSPSGVAKRVVRARTSRTAARVCGGGVGGGGGGGGKAERAEHQRRGPIRHRGERCHPPTSVMARLDRAIRGRG